MEGLDLVQYPVMPIQRVYTSMWFSLQVTAFTIREWNNMVDYDITLDYYNSEVIKKVLEGNYSSCSKILPVKTLVTEILIRVQCALHEVKNNPIGADIPSINIDLIQYIELIQHNPDKWLIKYTTNNRHYTVRWRAGVIEINLSEEWDICNTKNIDFLYELLERALQHATSLQNLEKEIELQEEDGWKNNILIEEWDESVEREDVRVLGVERYIIRYPPGETPPPEEEDAEV